MTCEEIKSILRTEPVDEKKLIEVELLLMNNPNLFKQYRERYINNRPLLTLK
tara:strand:+ start:4623 stop:4778 length:156 start_codon:yes stop_codon:yes gene_type:complete